MGKRNERAQGNQHDGIGILLPEGHLTLGDGDQDLTDEVENLLARGRRNLVLDMAGIDYIDAAGLGLLVRCHRKVIARGGRFILTGLRSKVRQILRLADLGAMLEHVQGLEQAVALLTRTEGPLAGSQGTRVA